MSEILEVAEAKRLDQKIRLLAGSISESLTKLQGLVEQARAGDIHVALGYPSWTAYVADVLKVEIRIGRDQRRELVSWLSGEGMSQRAIADVVGVDQKTVSNDLRSGEEFSSPEGACFGTEEEATDCLAMAALADDEFESVLADARTQDDLSRENVARLAREHSEQKRTTGLDNKSYPKQPRPQEPSKPRRGPITDDASRISLELGRIVKRLNKLVDDDRFDRNIETIASRMRPDVKFGLDILGRIDQKINGQGPPPQGEVPTPHRRLSASAEWKKRNRRVLSQYANALEKAAAAAEEEGSASIPVSVSDARKVAGTLRHTADILDQVFYVRESAISDGRGDAR